MLANTLTIRKSSCFSTFFIKFTALFYARNQYFNEDGDYIGERKIFNEAILLWIAGHSFNPKLSWINRIKNRFNIAPKKLPKEISNINGYTIYGRSEFIVLPENVKLFKTSHALHRATLI